MNNGFAVLDLPSAAAQPPAEMDLAEIGLVETRNTLALALGLPLAGTPGPAQEPRKRPPLALELVLIVRCVSTATASRKINHLGGPGYHTTSSASLPSTGSQRRSVGVS
jgi:hypothetical protein